MRRLFLIIIALLCSPAWAAIALVNSTSASDVTGSFVTSLAAPALSVTAGNCIAVFTHNEFNTVSSVTDTAGNTYTAATTYTRNNSVRWFVAKNITGNASNVVTMHITGGGGNSDKVGIIVLQYSGIDTSSPLDVDVGTTGFLSGTVTSPSFTTAQASEVVLMGIDVNMTGNPFSNGSGYTVEVATPSNWAAVQDQIFSSVQTGVTATMGWTGGFGDIEAAVISLKAASGGATKTCTLSTMGAGPC